MCGIHFTSSSSSANGKAAIGRISHRGPDAQNTVVTPAGVLSHARLCVVGKDAAAAKQPYRSGNNTAFLSVNGEIYNCKGLAKGLGMGALDSDCDVLLPLFQTFAPTVACQKIDGIFALVFVGEGGGGKKTRVVAARGAVGVNPLYFRQDGDAIEFASERKAMMEDGKAPPKIFPPGHVCVDGVFSRWYNPVYRDLSLPPVAYDPKTLKRLLTEAVGKRTMATAEYGLLLSGGLDSTLIASLAVASRAPGAEPLKSFSIGLRGSPDLKVSKKVAQWLGTDHHEYVFTVEEGLEALPEVVRSVETLDPTTIRAGTPMWLIMQRIRRDTSVKMLLSGEGSDEIFAGYLYFHEAPNETALARECLNKVEAIHRYDCQRANMTSMAHGIEVRCPFLDLDLLDYAMRLPNRRPKEGVEKWALRHAFDGDVPGEFLWRQKEQFSDGVGYAWIDSVKAHARSKFPDPGSYDSSEQALLASHLKSPGSLPRDSWNPVFQSNKDASGRVAQAHCAVKIKKKE